MIIDINTHNTKKLYISNREVSRMIKEGKPNWEEMVPKYISENIIKKGLFEYK